MKIFFDTEFIENGAAFVMIPVSIGMVKENGQTYYAEFNNVDWSKANDWVLENVKPHLEGPESPNYKSPETIKADIISFVGEKPEFWAYFADYDWVILCQLYGRMIDLPQGWPYYCRDLKQLMDHFEFKKENIPATIVNKNEHHALDDAIWNLRVFEFIRRCGLIGEQ